MKVILLAPTPPPMGGIAGWTERMLKAKLKNNWFVDVVDEKQIGNRDLFSSNKIKRNFKDEIVRCFRIWRELSAKVKDKDVHIVHSCIPSTTFAMIREYICAVITHFNHKKFIVHFRCTVSNTTKGKIGILVLKMLCNKSDYIVVLNNQSKQFINKHSKTQNVIIPNFVDIEEINSDFKVRQHLKRVIYVGGVIETKGALEAFELAKRNPDIEFEFVGDIPPENKKIADKYPNIILSGTVPHDEIKNKLLNADVFLFLTHFYGEGFSNALCEAMGVGMPCLVTDWAANADMISDGKGGYVVPVHDIESANSALLKMSEFSIRSKMSEYNKLKVKRNYSQRIVIDKYVDIYEKTLLCRENLE